MKRALLLGVVSSLLLAVGIGCGDSDDSDDGSSGSGGAAGSGGSGGAAGTGGTGGAAGSAGSDAPAGHTESMGGVMHQPGKEDPLASCTTCHGSDLSGGTASSCYTCHNADDHTDPRGGVKHKSGSGTTCGTCHGPSNGGGLGPACSDCH